MVTKGSCLLDQEESRLENLVGSWCTAVLLFTWWVSHALGLQVRDVPKYGLWTYMWSTDYLSGTPQEDVRYFLISFQKKVEKDTSRTVSASSPVLEFLWLCLSHFCGWRAFLSHIILLSLLSMCLHPITILLLLRNAVLLSKNCCHWFNRRAYHCIRDVVAFCRL